MATQKRKCTGICKNGRPCTAWAVHETNPPTCAAHGGSKKPVGAPKGNKNAEKHGGYSGTLPIDLDARITALHKRLRHVEQYLDTHADDLTPEEYIRLSALQGQLLSRLSREVRERDKAHNIADPMEADMDAVLKVLSAKFNIDLTGKKK